MSFHRNNTKLERFWAKPQYPLRKLLYLVIKNWQTWLSKSIFTVKNYPNQVKSGVFFSNLVSNNQILHVTSFSECAVTITKPFGVVTSPGYPQPYRNGIDCTWRIQVSMGQLIQFKFLHFDVDHDVELSYLGCRWDSSAASDIFPNLINLPH